MYRSRLGLYKKLFHFFRNLRADPNIKGEYRTYFAHILYSDIQSMLRAESTLLLDLGGARGEFCEVLKKIYHINCINLDPNAHAERVVFSPSVMGTGQNLPFNNDTFDVIVCRGVLEHVPHDIRQRILKEIYRTLKSDGIARIVIPPWFNPFAGHSLKPFHVLPFRLALFLATHVVWLHRETSHANAESLQDLKLYPITFRQMSRQIEKHGFEIVSCNDVLLRNHSLTRLPIIREFMVPSVAFNIRKIRTCA